MSPLRVPFAATATLLLGPALVGRPAFAQTIPSPYRYIETGQEAGIFIGYLGMGRGQLDLGPGDGPLLGARYGVEVGGPFSIEGVASYFPATRYVMDPRRVEGDRMVGEAQTHMVMADARIKFSLLGRRLWNGVGPYVLAGAGLAFDAAGEQPEEEDLLPDDRFGFGWKFLGLLGAGGRWLPSDRWAFRGDFTLNLWKIDTPDGYFEEDRGLESAPEGEWVSGIGFALGVAFRF